MRLAIVCALFSISAMAPAVAQFRAPDFTGVWKLEGAESKTAMVLEFKQDGQKLTGKLKTPYGELVVRRENNGGWVAERNGTPLRYLSVRYLDCRLSNVKIVFDNYLDAQTRALLWSFYPEKDRLINWYNLPQPVSPAA